MVYKYYDASIGKQLYEFLSKMRKEDRLHLFIKCVWKSRGTPVGGRLMKI